MDNTAMIVLLFVLGFGLAFLIYWLLRRVDRKSGCGCYAVQPQAA